MIRSRLFALLGVAAAVMATPVAAQSINGSYDGYGCVSQFRSDLALDITWPELQFHESSCVITGSTPGVVNGYEMSCSGEGETWTNSMILTPTADGGLIRQADGVTVAYTRC